jgi:hypothetical protein
MVRGQYVQSALEKSKGKSSGKPKVLKVRGSMSEVNSFQELSQPYGIWQRSEMILTIITPSMNHNSSYHEPMLVRRLRLELTIIFNLEDLLRL